MEPSGAKVRLERLAARQGGRVHHRQLTHLGCSRGVVRSWVRRRVLIPVRPRLYALGYPRTDLAARVWEAILHAGPDAYLTAASGAHQCGLINDPPAHITVATPWRRRSVPGITVLQSQPDTRVMCDGVPVAPIGQLMLDLAAEGDFNLTRRALANLDYRRELDIEALLAICVRGRPGSALLRRALGRLLPQLAYVNGDLELAFLLLLEARGLPLPKFNVRLHGILVDVYWKDLGLVLELDGGGNHGTPRQKRRDARYMETLRGHGLTVMRCDWWDVHDRADATLAALDPLGVHR